MPTQVLLSEGHPLSKQSPLQTAAVVSLSLLFHAAASFASLPGSGGAAHLCVPLLFDQFQIARALEAQRLATVASNELLDVLASSASLCGERSFLGSPKCQRAFDSTQRRLALLLGEDVRRAVAEKARCKDATRDVIARGPNTAEPQGAELVAKCIRVLFEDWIEMQ